MWGVGQCSSVATGVDGCTVTPQPESSTPPAAGVSTSTLAPSCSLQRPPAHAHGSHANLGCLLPRVRRCMRPTSTVAVAVAVTVPDAVGVVVEEEGLPVCAQQAQRVTSEDAARGSHARKGLTRTRDAHTRKSGSHVQEGVTRTREGRTHTRAHTHHCMDIQLDGGAEALRPHIGGVRRLTCVAVLVRVPVRVPVPVTPGVCTRTRREREKSRLLSQFVMREAEGAQTACTADRRHSTHGSCGPHNPARQRGIRSAHSRGRHAPPQAAVVRIQLVGTGPLLGRRYLHARPRVVLNSHPANTTRKRLSGRRVGGGHVSFASQEHSRCCSRQPRCP